MQAPAQKTYFWDFFGPRADGTARHFQKHLDDFLSKHALRGCRTGVASEGAGHQAVFCEAAPDAEVTIEGALRPRRVVQRVESTRG